MKNLFENYKNKVSENKAIAKEIQEKIDDKEKKIQSLNSQVEKLRKTKHSIKSVSWIDEIIIPLAKDLAKKMGMYYEVSGPFGLSSRISLYFFKDKNKDAIKQECWYLSIIPKDLETGLFEYETGEKQDGFSKNTIGEINDMNNVTAPLPDKSLDIIKILRHMECRAERGNIYTTQEVVKYLNETKNNCVDFVNIKDKDIHIFLCTDGTIGKGIVGNGAVVTFDEELFKDELWKFTINEYKAKSIKKNP